MRKAGVMEEMTPMADRHSSVDLVRDSNVGGMCWKEENLHAGESIFQSAAVFTASTWSMMLVSAENRFRICPKGVTSKNLWRSQQTCYVKPKKITFGSFSSCDLQLKDPRLIVSTKNKEEDERSRKTESENVSLVD